MYGNRSTGDFRTYADRLHALFRQTAIGRSWILQRDALLAAGSMSGNCSKIALQRQSRRSHRPCQGAGLLAPADDCLAAWKLDRLRAVAVPSAVDGKRAEGARASGSGH